METLESLRHRISMLEKRLDETFIFMLHDEEDEPAYKTEHDFAGCPPNCDCGCSICFCNSVGVE